MKHCNYLGASSWICKEEYVLRGEARGGAEVEKNATSKPHGVEASGVQPAWKLPPSVSGQDGPG